MSEQLSLDTEEQSFGDWLRSLPPCEFGAPPEPKKRSDRGKIRAVCHRCDAPLGKRFADKLCAACLRTVFPIR